TITDLVFHARLNGPLARLTIPGGEILSIRPVFDTGGFTLVDYRDIPGRNVVALSEDDQPCLAEREIRHAAEPIALIAHSDREKLLHARLDIEYRTRPPQLDPTASTKIFKELSIENGDLSRG